MALFRFEFPDATITPKLHILEDHVVDWTKKYGVGCGFFSEQGVEVSHSGINSISHYNKVPSKPLQLKLKHESHLLKTHPHQRCKQPKKKTRGPYKKKEVTVHEH